MLGLALLFVYGVSSVLLAFITLLGEEGAGLCSYRPHNASWTVHPTYQCLLHTRKVFPEPRPMLGNVVLHG